MNLGVVPIVNARIPYLNGFSLSNEGVSTMLVSDGVCSNSTNEIDISVITDSGQTTISVLSNGLNGLDTGTVAANENYAVYAIADIASNHPSGFLISTNYFSPPFMPTGYSAYRRIGFLITDNSSNVREFFSYNTGPQKYYQYLNILPAYSSLNATTFTSIFFNPTTSGPIVLPSISSSVIFLATYLPATAGNKFFLRQQRSSSDTSSSYNEIGVSATIATTREITFPVLLNSNAFCGIDYAVTESGDSLSLSIIGFTDNL